MLFHLDEPCKRSACLVTEAKATHSSATDTCYDEDGLSYILYDGKPVTFRTGILTGSQTLKQRPASAQSQPVTWTAWSTGEEYRASEYTACPS